MTKPTLSRYQRDPNFQQVARVARHQITATSLAIIDAIHRYRYIPTSLIFRLIGSDRRNLYYHLQALYHKHKLIDRLTLFSPSGWPEEFVYFLDSPRALELLCEQGIRRPDELDFERYEHGTSSEASEGHHFFVRHELMISRLRAMLELATVASDAVQLAVFRQGADLHSSVSAPGLAWKKENVRGRQRKMLYETGELEAIPHRPDAFFSLYFPKRPPGQQYAHFLYEADRKTTDTTRMIRKLRGHFHFIVKQKKHRTAYNVEGIRAVLIETLDTTWAESLRAAARHPAVSGPKPSNLFWFTSQEFFNKPISAGDGSSKPTPRYLEQPEIIFNRLWFSPNDGAGDRPRSILDP